jgi:predicted ArsR family transcriptional regulator
VLRNCPFDALAREHTELVCGMNLAIMTAVTNQLQETALAARLEPAPGRCCVVLVPAVPGNHGQAEESVSASSSGPVTESRTKK